jgi:nucleotide-binding universal stress UspA family protein
MFIEEATDAEVIVFAARGRGGSASVLVGSVSEGLVRHAQVPVAVG